MLKELPDFFEDFTPNMIKRLNDLRNYCNREFEYPEDFDPDEDDILETCFCYRCKSFYKEPLLVDRKLVCPNCHHKYDKEDQINFSYIYNELVLDFQDYLTLECGDPDQTIDDLTNYCSWITLFVEDYFKDLGLKLYFDKSVEVSYKYTTNL